jgi:hypothetical protein
MVRPAHFFLSVLSLLGSEERLSCPWGRRNALWFRVKSKREKRDGAAILDVGWFRGGLADWENYDE